MPSSAALVSPSRVTVARHAETSLIMGNPPSGDRSSARRRRGAGGLSIILAVSADEVPQPGRLHLYFSKSITCPHVLMGPFLGSSSAPRCPQCSSRCQVHGR